MLSRNKCEILAECLLAGVKVKYNIYGIGKVKNIELRDATNRLYQYLQNRLTNSGIDIILKPKNEIYWIWFDSITECFYIIENNIVKIKEGIFTTDIFDEVLRRANENIEKRKKWEDIAYV